MRPSNFSSQPSAVKKTLREANSLFHLLSKRIASSSDERMFILLVSELGLNQASQLAARLHLKCQRPSQVLRAMFGGFCKSYTKQSAKRKPPLDSPTSSKKRL
jgi:hypothetical protein